MSYAIRPRYTAGGIFALGASAADPYYEMRRVGDYQYRAVKTSQLPVVSAHLAKYRITKEGAYYNVPGKPGFDVLYGAEASVGGTGEPALQWALDKTARGEAIVIGTSDDFAAGDDIVFARIQRNMLPQLAEATEDAGAVLYEPKDGWIVPPPGTTPAPPTKATVTPEWKRYALYGAVGLGVIGAAVLLTGGKRR